jgi:hypothetical protein
MGLMDKVKAQATQLAGKAQEGAKAGQAKLSDMQTKKHADALLLELGGLVYSDRAGRGTPAGEQRLGVIITELQAFEAEHGPVAVTTALAAPPPPDGTSFIPGSTPAPTSTETPAPAPTTIPGGGGIPASSGGIPQGSYASDDDPPEQ